DDALSVFAPANALGGGLDHRGITSAAGFARRPRDRFHSRQRRWRKSPLGALVGHADRPASSRNRRRLVALLVARQSVHRILRWREAQEDRRVGRATHYDL